LGGGSVSFDVRGRPGSGSLDRVRFEIRPFYIGNSSTTQEEYWMAPRIVVTGMGTVNPLGLNVAETWENILGGVSGVGPITQFDASDFLVQIACEIKGFEPEQYMPAREARRRDRFEHLASAAASQALSQSGFEVAEANADRVGSSFPPPWAA
jgi:hypothetical protein